MKLLASVLVVPAALLLLLTAACGGDDDDSGAAASAPTATAAPPVVLNVSTQDNSFAPATANARAGQKVTVNVKNDGQRPHSFTIDGVVDTGRLDAGQSKTVEFTPSSAGSLSFYCTIHSAAVMSGTINVSSSAMAEPGDSAATALAP